MDRSWIAYLFRCISAEILKTRRSLSLLGVIAMPTTLSLLNFLLMLGMSRENEYAAARGWLSFAHNTLSFWPMLVLPCVIVLVAAFSAQQEHGGGHWRTLMYLPLPKSSLYTGKLAVVSGLILLSCLILWGENIFWGWLFSVLRPHAGLSMARLDLPGLLLPFLLFFLYSLLLQAIHFAFSLHVRSFVLTIGVGFFLSLLGAFLHDQAIVRVIFPWCLPSLVRSAGSWLEGVIGLVYSAAGFALVTALSCRAFTRKDMLC